jgi:signal transduction histidine kinase/PAS domain-containing protein
MTGSRSDGERIRVLLVLDDGGNADRVRRTLGRAGRQFVVERAPDGERAPGRLARIAPDVVILEAPGPDDGRALEQWRASAPQAALILLARDDAYAEALRSSRAEPTADDYLVASDLDSTLLPRSVRSALERHRLVCELEQRVRSLAASEASFRTIITTTADGIVIVDREGSIRFANPAAERLFGRAQHELIGEPFGFPLVSGETTEIDLVRGPGETLVAELRVSDTEWAGAPARLASLRDITERRRAEEHARELIREQAARAEAEAAERRARFLGEVSGILGESLGDRSALQRVADRAVPFLGDWCIVDLLEFDGTVERVAVACAEPGHDDLAERVLRGGPDVARPCGVAHTLASEVASRSHRIEDELIASIVTDPDAAVALTKLGFHDALLVPLRNRHRTLGCLTLLSLAAERYGPQERTLADDLARRAGIAVDNARLLREVQQANRAKADFLAIMSHELRTPLNAVIGYSDLMLLGVQGELARGPREYIERIRTSARHLLSLIEEILTYARTEAGREQIRVGPVALHDVVTEVGDLTESLAVEKGIGFRLQLIDGVIMETDAGKLRQILVNLLSNAVKFTDRGKVELLVTAGEEAVEFIVRDTGPGIRPEHLDQIFEPFWQAEQSRTRRAEGTGLGLAVARRLTRMLGGEIRVESVGGKGTEFTVWLPRSTYTGGGEGE